MLTLKSNRLLIGAMSACLAFCLILALNWIPELRGDFGWRWPYAVPDWARLVPLILTVAVYVIGALRIRSTRLLLAWCFLGAVAIPLASLFLLGDPLYLLATRTLSGQATGPHMAGVEIKDLAYSASHWPEIMPTYYEPRIHPMMSVHIALSPPGLPIFYYFLNRLFDHLPTLSDVLGMPLRYFQCQNYATMAYTNADLASAWFGILMPVWAGLAVFPLYTAAGGGNSGRLAAMWWPLVPSLAMFTPVWNTFYPLLALGAFLALRAGLCILESTSPRRFKPVAYLVLSGIFLSFATFFNVSIIPFIGFLGLYTLIILIQRWQARSKPLRQIVIDAIGVGLLFGLGLLSVWIVYYLASGVTPMAVFGTALGLHLGFERPYLPWVYLHLYDLALFAGLPLVILALAAVWNNLRLRSLASLDPMGIALILNLIILAISGTARGETGRVWLFFVPFILILAARQVNTTSASISPFPSLRGEGVAVRGIVTITQAITLITLVGFLRVLDTEFNAPPSLPPGDQIARVETPFTVASFGGNFSLIGQHAEATKDGIDLTLSWRSDRQMSVPYYLSALVVKPDGQAVPPAIDWQPFETRFPTTCWQPGQIVTETRHIALPANVAPGDYWISLSAFDIRDDKRLPVTQPGNPASDQIGLGPIPVR